MDARLGTRWPLAVLVIVAMAVMATAGRGQEPENRWAAGVFGIPGVDWYVRDVAVWEDGTGPALYVGGQFNIAGRVFASRIARWDGRKWSALGDGVSSSSTNAEVITLLPFDDGSGPALYVAGRFETAGGQPALNIARWDGRAWAAVGAGLGVAGDRVSSLAIYDDGSGPALFAAVNSRIPVGSRDIGWIMRWDGAAWTLVTDALDGGVYTLASVATDGPARLAVGGSFQNIGGVHAKSIALWDGNGWSRMHEGFDGPIHNVTAFDDGSGPAIYAAGEFSRSGLTHLQVVSRWDGRRWQPVGGVQGRAGMELLVHDDGSGSSLYVGGFSIRVEGDPSLGLLRWDGRTWSPVGDLPQGATALALAPFDDGRGPSLFIGGHVWHLGGPDADHVARWDGRDWHALGAELGEPRNIYALEPFDDGSGRALYVGGQFCIGDGVDASQIARWHGDSWSAVGGGLHHDGSQAAVYVLEPADVSGTRALYAGGRFTTAGAQPAANVARWDGSSWTAVGAGVTGGPDPRVFDILAFDDGDGPALFVAGEFTHAGGLPAANVARWDGAGWSPLDAGLDGVVCALAVFDDGRGPALYAAGQFERAGGVDAANVARWDGRQWEPLDVGTNLWIRTMITADLGDGPAIYVGGFFALAGGQPAKHVARWDGRDWSPLGEGLFGGVRSLHVSETSRGRELIAGGEFTSTGEISARRIARWDGQTWANLGPGLEGRSIGERAAVRAIQTFNDGSGPALFVGGDFTFAGGHVSPGLARWSLACAADIDGDGSLTVFDFLAFLTLFDAIDPIADFDGDGEFTIFDFLAFQTAFDAGCG